MGELVYSQAVISRMVQHCGQELDLKFEGSMKPPILLVVLKGAVPFATALSQQLSFDHKIEYVEYKSYGESNKQGKVRRKHSTIDFSKLKGENIIVVEDIVDSGATLREILLHLHNHEPNSITTVTLCERKGQKPCVVDIRGVLLKDNSFLYGFGMDDNQIKRNLKSIYKIC